MLSKFSLRAKILFLGIFLSGTSCVVGLMSYHYLNEIKAEYAFLPEKIMPKLEHMNNMYLTYRRVRIEIRTLGLPGLSQGQAAETLQEVDHAIEEYEKQDQLYVSLDFIPGQKELYDNVHRAWGAFRKVGEEAVSLYKLGTEESRQKMIHVFLTDCPAKAKEYTAAIHALEEFHKKIAHKKAETATEISQSASKMTIVIILLGTLIGLALSITLSITLSSSLTKIGTEVSQATSQTSAASSQLAAASHQLSSSSSETSSSLAEIVSSLEELTSIVKMNSKNAKQASEVSESSQQTAQMGETEILNLISAMNDMAESSQKIEDITNVIDDIAFQTNLLALNAAVEAARAGEQGKGFAVVAEAVRSLAQRSASAAKDIASLIKETVAKTQNGARIAGKSQEVLIKILQATKQVVDLNREIATGTQEQSNGIQQISMAMNQLDQATQTNSASANEVAASSEEMAAQATTLSGLVLNLQDLIEGQNKTEFVTEKISVASRNTSSEIRLRAS